MKIKGKKPNFFKSQTIEIEDDKGELYTFFITAPSLDFHEQIEKMIPSPIVPSNFARDQKGRVARDDNGRPVIVKDEDDKAYREKLRETQQLHSTMVVYEGLKNDKNIEFESQKDKFENTIDFAKAIRNEMIELLPMPVFLKLIDTIGKMMNISEETIKEAEEAFRK